MEEKRRRVTDSSVGEARKVFLLRERKKEEDQGGSRADSGEF